MKKCYVMVGMPACGKSYLMDQFKTELDNPWIYSTDMYIEAIAEDHGITYNDAFEGAIDDATRFNNNRVAQAFKESRDVIWDQTNLGVKKRKKIISQAKKYGYEVIAQAIISPDDETTSAEEFYEWRRRLLNRPGKNIPDHILYSMKDAYVYPSLEEGFDKVNFYDIWGKKIK